jgi:cytochrome c556
MKKALVFFATLGLSFGADQVILKKPPASLGKYYPPQSNKFEYVSVMHEMSTAFYGVRLNINEGRWDRALDWANRLKDAYTRAQNMVPEWKDYFKPALADQLINAVRAKNPDQVIKASRELGETCTKCHAENQIAVKLVYHYPPFATLKMEDPIEFAQLSPKEYMRKLSDSMKALRIFLLQGDVQKAREAGEQVVERVKGTEAICSKCHTDKTVVDRIHGKDHEQALASIQKLLKEPQPNRDAIFKAMSVIGQSCNRCHNLHLVPAMVQEAFRK